MQIFPDTAEAFYALRDDRTNRCTADVEDGRAYQRKHVAVFLDPARAITTVGSVLLKTTTALLARWCRKVTIVAELAAPIGRALDAMRDADPFGQFSTSTTIPADADFVLRLGGSGAGDDVRIDGSNWIAQVGRGDHAFEQLPDGAHPLGAVAAACFGVAEVFRRAVGFPPFRESRSFDLLRLAWQDSSSSDEDPARDLGSILLVGGGAVGSCTAYTVNVCDFVGRFMVIDYDDTKIENFNRSPLCAKSTHNVPKAEAIASSLRAGGSTANAFVGDWNAFVKSGAVAAQRGATVWIPVANERNVRFSIQRNFPPVAVQASTGANWSVNYGRHDPEIDDCVLCRFPVDGASDSGLACATSAIPTTEGDHVDAALPFASLLTGVLVVAELARRTLLQHELQTPNFVLFDFFPPGFSLVTQNRSPLASCDCRNHLGTSRAVNRRLARRG